MKEQKVKNSKQEVSEGDLKDVSGGSLPPETYMRPAHGFHVMGKCYCRKCGAMMITRSTADVRELCPRCAREDWKKSSGK